MRTISLSGKKAAGRVTRVDDGDDYEVVIQHRWRVSEHAGSETTRPWGPYAVTTIRENGRQRTMGMHQLLTGWPLTDHIDHDGLNNQRSNLRPATKRQNGQNARSRLGSSSDFKGVIHDPKQDRWRTHIVVNGRRRFVCHSTSELECAYAYDAAAREFFGEYASTNFPAGPTPAMLDQWRAEREQYDAASAEKAAAALVVFHEGRSAFWVQRTAHARICEFCGDEYQTRATGISRYCSPRCCGAAWRQRRKGRTLEVDRPDQLQ